MMNYEVFKAVVENSFPDYLPEGYKSVEIYPVDKVNKPKDAIRIIGLQVAPALYVNDMYEHYLQEGDADVCLRKAADAMMEAVRNAPEIKDVGRSLESLSNVIYCLVNTEQNHDLLLKVPHRQFLDLSIIYRSILSVDERGIQSAIITNEFAQKSGWNEEELHEAAVENTRRIMKPTVRNLFQYLAEQMEIPEEALNDTTPMYFVSNETGLHGAASVLDPTVLDMLAETLGGAFYILPSSIHEMIIVPDIGALNPDELRQMVEEVNATEVSPEEKLSDSVYRYDTEKKVIELA